ncbi:MAG: hypothetical protein ABR947_03390 [Solirubrobacteraceae bacterium]
MMGRAASRLGQRLVAAALAVGAVVASAFAGVRPRARGPRPRVVRAIRLLLPLAVAGMALLVLTTSAESDVGLPVNIDTFGNSALTAGPFTRTVIPLPLPMTSTTPVGTFSQGGDVGTMEMTGLGNGFSGVTLQYTPTAGGSVDLTSDGSNAQILIDFALIDEVPAVGDDSVPGLDMYINATDANGHTAIAPLDAIGNYFAFNAAFPFSGFEGTIDWTKITKIDVTFQYPTTNTGGGTLGVQVNQIWATPEAGTPPSAPSPTVTASPTAIGPAGTAVDFTVSFTSDEGPAPVTYHPPSDIGVRAQDLTVSGSAFGGATPVVKVSGGPSTYTVAVSGMTVSGGVTVDVPGGIVDDAWGQLNTASSDDPTVAYTFAIPCSAGSWSATGYMPCQLADPGYFVSGTQATSESPCAAGTYSSSSGATACTNTPAGTFIASMGAIAPGGSCLAGTYSAAGASACTNTPAGTFIPGNGATGPGSSCLAGTYSAAGASACTNTPAGTFISGTGASGPGGSCPAGTYSATAGATACTNTPAGTSIAGTGATGPGASCPAGTYSTAGASACTNTPAGTFIASPGAAGPGSSCPAGTYSSTAGATSCTNTPAGTFISGNGATGPGASCPAGTYSSTPGATTCTITPPGTYIGSIGATGSATPCPVGTYSLGGAMACTACPSGYSTATTGSTSVAACSVAEVATTLIASPQVDDLAPWSAVGSFVVSATLTSGGSPIKSETITFKLGSTVLCTATTHANGVASCSLTFNQEQAVLRADSYAASFAGAAQYKPSNASTAAAIF